MAKPQIHGVAVTATIFNMAALAEHFGYLYARWQDERENEDFEGYRESLKSRLPADAKLVSFTKSPFRAELVLIDGTRKWLRCNAKEVSWGGYKC